MTHLKPYPQFLEDREECESRRDLAFTQDEAQRLLAMLKQANYLRLNFDYHGCPQRRTLIQNLLAARGVNHGFIEINFDNEGDRTVFAYHTAAWATLDDGEKVVFDLPKHERLISPEEYGSFWVSQGNARHIPRIAVGFASNKSPEEAIKRLFEHRPQII